MRKVSEALQEQIDRLKNPETTWIAGDPKSANESCAIFYHDGTDLTHVLENTFYAALDLPWTYELDAIVSWNDHIANSKEEVIEKLKSIRDQAIASGQ